MRQEIHHVEEHPIPRLPDAAIAQLYRGELSRSDRWRMRLDTTTNWALTTTAGVISYSFSNADTSHVTLLVGIWMVITFLAIEARRYRYYDLWNRRLRLLEDGYWGPLLRREPQDPDAMRELAMEMERPELRLSLFSALATRMHRAYGPILLVLLAAWFIKVGQHPTPAKTLGEIAARARMAFVPGAVVLGVLFVGTLAAAMLFASSFLTRQPLGELRPRPRSRRRALWEAFARPYELAPPRLAQRRRARAAAAGGGGPGGTGGEAGNGNGAGPGTAGKTLPPEGARSAPS
jgi:uncharacterized membrane protein